jgi:RHS repeat-associated protein
VTKATPTITWPTPAPITYGTALSSTQLDATANVPGSFAYTPALGTVLPAGSQTLSTTFTPTDTTDYTTATASVTLSVNKATPTITWPTPAAITYGTPLSSTQLDATANVPGSFVYNPASGTVLGVGSQTLSTTFTPTDTTDYTTATATVTLSVAQATPTITWPIPAAITYGTALSSTQLDATANVPGSFVYNPASGTVLGAGSQTLSTTFTPTDTTDYTTATASVTLNVTKATPTITWPPPAAITYGTGLSSTQLDATANVPGSFVYNPASGTVLGVGSQTLSTTFTPTDTTDYTTATTSVTLSVTKALLTVTANPASVTYGGTLPAFTATYSGFVNGDTFASAVTGSPSLTTTATSSSPVGSYTITAAQGTLAAANYTFTFVNGTLTVTMAGTSASVSSNNNPSTYGANVTFTATVTPSTATGSVTFLDAGTSIGTATVSGGTATFTTSTLPAGSHSIIAAYGGDSNYTGSTSSALGQTVNKATPTITWPAPAAITYGTALSSTQLDATANVPGSFAYNPASGAVLAAGSQTLSTTFTPTDTTDYTTATASAPLTVGQATSSISVTSSPDPSIFGSAVTFTATVTPSTATGSVTFMDGGNAIGSGTLSSGTAAFITSTLAAGSHSITASYGGDSNDSASTSSALTQTVTSAAPTITSFAPASASIGTAVSVTGTNFTANGATPVVTLYTAGASTIVAPLMGASATSLSFVVPTGAATGPITVTVNGQSGTSSTPLTIVAASTFTLTAAPSSVTLLPSESTTVSVSLASANGFTQLAALAISGLPSGVTASFQPPAITAGGSSVLTLTAPAGQSPGSSPLAISASATVQGVAQSQSATVTLNIQAPGGVAFQGRAAVTNASYDIPLVGLTVRFLGVDYQGNSTGCTASTQTDSSGNFVFASLPSACSGPQMVQYDPSTVSSPPGSYSGVNLSYVLTPGQVTTPGLVIHLPNVGTVQTVQVQQNGSADQTFTFSNIPGLTITVYAGTTLSLADGTQPDPFPLSVVEIPYEQVPDYMPPNPTQDPVFAMSIEPFNSSASQPVAVSFPNRSNLPPGSAMPLTSLNPTLGMMVAYGTGTVSADGTQVVPDLDPSHPGHLYGISHFDWHFPLCNVANSTNPSPDPNGPKKGDPVDPASGLLVVTKTDIAFGGARGQAAITRTFRGMSGNPGPFGVGTNYNYNIMLSTLNVSTGLIELIMPDGNQYPFIQQANGTFSNTTIPSMRGAVLTKGTCVTTAYGYGCGGSLRWKDGTVYTFQSLLIGQPWAGFLTSITDPNGNTTTLVHDASVPSNIDRVIDPVGRALNISWVTYGSNGAYGVSSITDPIGRSIQYTYNSAGMLSTVTDANGGVTTYGYDSNNSMVSITDPRGITYLQNTFDSNGRVIKQVAADGGVTTFSYTQANPTIQTSPVLYTVVTDPLGNQTTYHFNPAGFLLDVTDALGEKTVYTRDPATNLLQSVTDPLGRVTAYTYDANGNTTSVTALAGTPGAVTASYTYDPTFNKVTTITDPLGHTTTLTYDGVGNLLTSTDALGDQSAFAYDGNGEMTSSTDALGNTTRFAYTNGDLTQVTDPLGRASRRVADAVSRLIQSTNPLGRSTEYQYNPLNELTQVVDRLGNSTQFAYDGNGNLTGLTDALGHVTTYAYDSMDRLATRTDPLGHGESYQYDQNGNLTQFTDRRSVVTTNAYDALNRLAQASFGGQSSITYAYDAGGRLTQAVDSITGTISRAYDGLNRVTSELTPHGSVGYSYDNAGRRTGMTVSGQSPVSYAYDNANRLTQIAQGTSTVSLNHDGDGRRTALTLPNGVTKGYGYDAASELTTINYQLGATSLGNLIYTYDLAGRRSTVGGSYAQTNLPSPLASASYNANNQLVQLGSASLTYDANGNLTSDGTHTYTWDARNHLVSISGAVSASFQYDPFGRRVTKAIGAATTNYLYDGVNPVQELSGGSPTANLLTGLHVDEYFQRTDASGPANFLTDALGSTIALTGATGNTLSSYTYDPFGSMTVSGSSSNPYQYTGREDDGTGVYYYRRRYYSPALQRFISEDPIGFEGGVNLYAYVGSNPIGFTDPYGLDKKPNGACASGQNRAYASAFGKTVMIATPSCGFTLATGGTITLVTQTGNHPWRDNNPGDIQSGNFASTHGSIGNDNRIAIFPSASTGYDALMSLLQTQSYQTQTLDDAIARYAPPSENDTASYQASVSQALGVGGGTTLSSLNAAQTQQLANTIAIIEGFYDQGTTTTQTIIVRPQSP